MNTEDHPAVIGGLVEEEQAPDSSPDMTGDLIHDEGAQQFQDKLDEWIVEHIRWIMALSCPFEKAGKT